MLFANGSVTSSSFEQTTFIRVVRRVSTINAYYAPRFALPGGVVLHRA